MVVPARSPPRSSPRSCCPPRAVRGHRGRSSPTCGWAWSRPRPPSRCPPSWRGTSPGTGGSTTRWTRGRSPTPWPGLSRQLGPVERLVGALEQLQVPLAQAREALGIPGHGRRDRPQRARQVADEGGAHARPGCPARATSWSARADEALAFARGGRLPAGREAARGRRARRRPTASTTPTRCAAGCTAIPPRPEAPGLLEEFLVGDEHTFDSVHDRRRDRVGVDLGLPAAAARGAAQPVDPVDGAAAPRPRRPALRGRSSRSARPRCGRSASATALTHMEWFRRPDGSVAVSEVGARPPGAQLAIDARLRARRRLLPDVVRAGDPRPVRRRRSGSTPRAARTCVGRAAAGCGPCTASTSCSGGSGTSSSRRKLPEPGQPASTELRGRGLRDRPRPGHRGRRATRWQRS